MKASNEEIQALLDFVLPMNGIVDQKDSNVALTLALNYDFSILLRRRILDRLRACIISNISNKALVYEQYNNTIDKYKIGEGVWGFRKATWPSGAFSCFEITRAAISVGIIFPLRGVIKVYDVEVAHKDFRKKLRLASEDAINCLGKMSLDKRQNDSWACWINWIPSDLVNGGYIDFAQQTEVHAKNISEHIDAFAVAIDLASLGFKEAS